MSRRKAGMFDWFADFSIHSLLFHPFSLFLIATMIVLIGAATLWKQHQEQIAAERFQLAVESIQVSQQPDWIREDLRQAAYDGSRLGDWSLLDTETVTQVRDAFSIQPWVKEVLRVEKSADKISVDLEYRRPVAMVEFGDRHLLPIDADGIILDGSGFSVEQVRQYLRITVPHPVQGQIVTGQPWPDARVVAAARIAEFWQDRWKEAGLFRIVNRSAPTKDFTQVGEFEIWSKSNARLVWGHQPGAEPQQEASAQDKMLIILEDAKKNGPFDQREGINLDVRRGEIQQIAQQMRRVSHRKEK